LAHETWLKDDSTSRHFITIDTDDNQIQVKVFLQIKGDYQDKISTYPFKTLDNARSFIQKKFPEYVPIEKLPSWPVDVTIDVKRKKALWTAYNHWSEEWEQRYADWLKSEITEDFYSKYNIPTDCADAVVGYRWIFARIYSLPVANTVSDTGSLFGHFSMRKQWKNLTTAETWNEDQLFLAALNYVMEMTSTRTVMNTDGFPVSITKKGLQAGTFIVSQINGSGHMRQITQNYYDNPNSLPVFTFSSTSPRELRPLYKEAFIDQAWPIRKTREIMAFRWPVVIRNSWTLKAKESDSRYSLEQFDLSLEEKYYSFIQFVLSRVQPYYVPNSLVSTGVIDLVNFTNMRIQIVRNGYAYCLNHDCRPGTQGWEDWSTPSRDAKYNLKFIEVEDLVRTFDPMYPGLLASWIQNLDSTIMNIEGHQLSLGQLRSLFERKIPSSNPSDPILKRWGL
jgi:hypothetical protein